MFIAASELIEYHNKHYSNHRKENLYLYIKENPQTILNEILNSNASEDTTMDTSQILPDESITDEGAMDNALDSTESVVSPPVGLNITALDMDTETLDQILLQNRQYILKDHDVQDYVNSQQLHKANFLKEISDKGLKLKGQVDSAPPAKKRHLDY